MTDEASRMDDDIRPVVRTAAANSVGVWFFVIGIAVVAILLFQALNSRRLANAQEQSGVELVDYGARIVSPPPLNIPAQLTDVRKAPPQLVAVRSPPAQVVSPAAPPQRSPETRSPEFASRTQPVAITQPTSSQPRILVEAPPAISPASVEDDDERVRATIFANPNTTVPKGTIIASVLETALDSTRPGFARAIVSRDVRSFDGSNVLIPRGSKLFGEYKADLERGQNRALVVWQRLLRPDGVMINLASPSSDPLGRTGIKGKVNSHFLERFGGAILQSILDIGVNVASREVAGDTVVVALPGSATTVVDREPTEVQPTLKVKHGKSVSVFVARDLDFSTVEN